MSIRRKIVALVVSVLMSAAFEASAADQPPEAHVRPDALRGRELFERVWTPEKSVGKDGLGPLFNERSCVACHSQGGVGGAGPNSKNVELLTLVVPEEINAYLASRQGAGSFLRQEGEGIVLAEKPRAEVVREAVLNARPGGAMALALLETRAERIHRSLRSGGIMLHTFGTDSRYAMFREQALGLVPLERLPVASRAGADDEVRRPPGDSPVRTIRHGDLTLKYSQRNSPAMFGIGLIDDIRGEDILAVADEQARGDSGVKGRFVGRFGWRGQTVNLMEFVKGACVLELGLEIEVVPQVPDPIRPTMAARERVNRAKRIPLRPRNVVDLSAEQVDDLFVFVKSLPAPGRRIAAAAGEAEAVRHGEEVFASVGCAKCHRPNLGGVKGIYSDLLVHKMGPLLDDPQTTPPKPTGGLYYNTETSLGELIGQATDEWRTPPLWGLADSAPYLHDGRAATIDEAVRQHGGEARSSYDKYVALSPADLGDLHAFLSSLVAPDDPSLKPRSTSVAAAARSDR